MGENEEKLSTSLENAISYALSLQGVPYRHWMGSKISLNSRGPFYVVLNGGLLPNHGELAKEGMTPTGLINLMRHHAGLPIPCDMEEQPGGTGSWWLFLTAKGKLQTFDPAQSYPRGTMLFRPYKYIYEQGHAAIILDENVSAQDSRLLHCYDPVGVHVDSKVSKSHGWFVDGYYQYAVHPSIWFSP